MATDVSLNNGLDNNLSVLPDKIITHEDAT